MAKYRVDVFDDFWHAQLQKRIYLEANSEAQARSKGYGLYIRGLLFPPIFCPCIEVNIVAD